MKTVLIVATLLVLSGCATLEGSSGNNVYVVIFGGDGIGLEKIDPIEAEPK